MDTATLSRRQEADAPPAHLQQDEREDEPGKQEVMMLARRTEVQINQIAQPSGQCPCFLGIPRPIVAPGFLGPQSAHRHAKGKKSPSYAHQIVAYGHLMLRNLSR